MKRRNKHIRNIHDLLVFIIRHNLRHLPGAGRYVFNLIVVALELKKKKTQQLPLWLILFLHVVLFNFRTFLVNMVMWWKSPWPPCLNGTARKNLVVSLSNRGSWFCWRVGGGLFVMPLEEREEVAMATLQTYLPGDPWIWRVLMPLKPKLKCKLNTQPWWAQCSLWIGIVFDRNKVEARMLTSV